VFLWWLPARQSTGAWYGPAGVVASLARGNVPAIAALLGPTGLSGGAPVTNVVTGANVVAGQAIALNRATRLAILADNSYKPSSFVLGIARESVVAGFAVDVQSGFVTLSDWTAATGTASLQPGVPYFLGTAGQLTLTAPAAPSVAALVGMAVSLQTLNVVPQPPIQL
jgi:hypothetical protein